MATYRCLDTKANGSDSLLENHHADKSIALADRAPDAIPAHLLFGPEIESLHVTTFRNPKCAVMP